MVSEREHAHDVDALVAAGRVLEAIEVLNRFNREHRDSATEARLVELRRDAPIPAPANKARRPWPPKVRDRFRHIAGIPEVTREQLTPKVLRSGILRHGCLLVRGFMDQPRVEQLVADIDHAFTAYDAHVAGAPTADAAPWFVPFEPGEGLSVPREWIRDGDGVLAVDSPRTLFDVIEAFDEVGVRELVTAFLGEPPLMLASKWTLRRVAPKGSPDWHQDGAFMGADIRSLDIWLSLSHCGVDAPGLDVVGRRLDGIAEVGTNGAIFDWSVGEGTIAQLAPGGVDRPVFEPGDALLFDHLLLHRTGIHPAMTRDRYAIEAWFAAPSAYPPTGLPIAY